MQAKRCAVEMPPADERVLVRMHNRKGWFVAEWRPDAGQSGRFRSSEMENGAAWVSDESDVAGETICYLPSEVTHWCALPGDPNL